MRRPEIFPAYNDGVALWPKGPRWNTAVFLTAVEHNARIIHVWRTTITDAMGQDAAYLNAVVWPHGWHKRRPALCLSSFVSLRQPLTPAMVIASAKAELDQIDAEGPMVIVHDPDIVADTPYRDPL